jgi:hypothetical protein
VVELGLGVQDTGDPEPEDGDRGAEDDDRHGGEQHLAATGQLQGRRLDLGGLCTGPLPTGLSHGLGRDRGPELDLPAEVVTRAGTDRERLGGRAGDPATALTGIGAGRRRHLGRRACRHACCQSS